MCAADGERWNEKSLEEPSKKNRPRKVPRELYGKKKRHHKQKNVANKGIAISFENVLRNTLYKQGPLVAYWPKP